MAQQTIKMCTGCGWLNTKPLGLNMYGEPYSACCPDNNYKEVTAVEWLSIMLRDNSEELFDGNIFEQAKAMEKEQIEKAYIEGAEMAKEVLKDELKEFIVLPKTYGNL